MLNMTLRLSRPDKNTLVLRLPYTFRLILALAAVALLVGMIGREGFAVVPFIVILLLAAAASYMERWRFSLADGEVRYRVGLPFAYRQERYPISEVEALGLNEFTKGRLFESGGEEPGNDTGPRLRPFKRRYVRLSLFLITGDELDIETQPARGGRDVGDRAEEICRFIGKPLRRE